MLDYDSSKPENYLMYCDARNLHSWTITQRLHFYGFRWISRNAVDIIPADNLTGYILEVDLAYPQVFHNKHSDRFAVNIVPCWDQNIEN